MTTTSEPTTALATREFSDTQLQQRMKANVAARFGMQDATPAQLNVIFLVAKRWGLDPLTEITLYEGRPFITLDGRLQLMRRNPDYRGYRTRPLTREERENWGYEPDDIVVECTVLTHSHGEVVERGRVARAEVDAARKRAQESGKRAAPIGNWAPEIAEARAIKRSARAAFGQDVPDEDDAGYVIEERNDPVRTKALASRYDELYPTEAEMDRASDPPVRQAPVTAEDGPHTSDEVLPCSIRGCKKMVSSLALQNESQEKFAAVMCRSHLDLALEDAAPDPEEAAAR